MTDVAAAAVAASTAAPIADKKEELKLPVLEDDDQFSEFEQEDWSEAQAAGAFEAELWQDDWDDDEAKADPEFAFQLRAEMERIASQAK